MAAAEHVAITVAAASAVSAAGRVAVRRPATAAVALSDGVVVNGFAAFLLPDALEDVQCVCRAWHNALKSGHSSAWLHVFRAPTEELIGRDLNRWWDTVDGTVRHAGAPREPYAPPPSEPPRDIPTGADADEPYELLRPPRHALSAQYAAAIHTRLERVRQFSPIPTHRAVEPEPEPSPTPTAVASADASARAVAAAAAAGVVVTSSIAAAAAPGLDRTATPPLAPANAGVVVHNHALLRPAPALGPAGLILGSRTALLQFRALVRRVAAPQIAVWRHDNATAAERDAYARDLAALRACSWRVLPLTVGCGAVLLPAVFVALLSVRCQVVGSVAFRDAFVPLWMGLALCLAHSLAMSVARAFVWPNVLAYELKRKPHASLLSRPPAFHADTHPVTRYRRCEVIAVSRVLWPLLLAAALFASVGVQQRLSAEYDDDDSGALSAAPYVGLLMPLTLAVLALGAWGLAMSFSAPSYFTLRRAELWVEMAWNVAVDTAETLPYAYGTCGYAGVLSALWLLLLALKLDGHVDGPYAAVWTPLWAVQLRWPYGWTDWQSRSHRVQPGVWTRFAFATFVFAQLALQIGIVMYADGVRYVIDFGETAYVTLPAFLVAVSTIAYLMYTVTTSPCVCCGRRR